MNAIVQLEGLKKNYGGKEAVKGIDLVIPPGELFVLLGPNGAGKTSTLKMLVGLLKPSAGFVRVNGVDMTGDPMKAKKFLSYVPDIPYIYEKLTPREALRFMGKLYDMEPAAIRAQGDELLRFFGLQEVADALIEQFSHGMRQKVILAAALLHNPKVFVLDEPMVGLDAVSIHAFKELLKRKVREGMTVIFSTHTLPLAEELADRIGILAQGQLVALGTMAELRAKYQSKENLEMMFLKLVEQQIVQAGHS